MVLTNTENSYGLVSKFLHWVIAVMVITMLIVGFVMGDLDTQLKLKVYALHKATGLLVLLFVIIRLLWKFYNTVVILPVDLPNWQKKAATINMNLLYILMFVMPISGFLMTILAAHNIDFYSLFTIKSFIQNKQIAAIFNKIHKSCAVLFSALIILHILAAFYHYFIRKDNVLGRML